MTIHFRIANIDGLDIFYREAGPADAPVVLLLHGFPTSSHMFRDLIPQLQGNYRVIAPDLPGFGQSAQPSRDAFTYSFDNLANVIDGLVRANAPFVREARVGDADASSPRPSFTLSLFQQLARGDPPGGDAVRQISAQPAER